MAEKNIAEFGSQRKIIIIYNLKLNEKRRSKKAKLRECGVYKREAKRERVLRTVSTS